MINRILIRTKVVQMLYSYLLTQSEFRINDIETHTADSRYARLLSLSLLQMIMDMTGHARHADMPSLTEVKPLKHSMLAASLAVNAELRGIIERSGLDMSTFDSCLVKLRDQLLTSAVYRSFSRASADKRLEAEIKLWKEALRLVIAPDPDFQAAARKMEGYTRAGFERGLIAAVEVVESYGLSNSHLNDARRNLQRSLNKAYELYHSLLWLPVEITRLQDRRLDAARHKYLPTDNDLNPDLRFVNNSLIKALEQSEEMEEYRKEHPYDWTSDPMLVDKLLKAVLVSDAYKTYMAKPAPVTPSDDAELWRELMRSVILTGDALAETLEEQSVFWNDDLDIMGTFVLKTIRRFGQGDNEPKLELLPKYKDEEDAAFGAQLFDLAVDNRDLYRSYIDRYVKRARWEADRLAFMDVVVMITAITEICHFPAIPLAVSYNEYIEIAKSYSTERSGEFINGMLHSIVEQLRVDGVVVKS